MAISYTELSKCLLVIFLVVSLLRAADAACSSFLSRFQADVTTICVKSKGNDTTLLIGQKGTPGWGQCVSDKKMYFTKYDSASDTFTPIAAVELPDGVRDSSFIVSQLSPSDIATQMVDLSVSNDYPASLALDGLPSPVPVVPSNTSRWTYSAPGADLSLPSRADAMISSYIRQFAAVKLSGRQSGAILVSPTASGNLAAYIVFRQVVPKKTGKQAAEVSVDVFQALFAASPNRSGSSSSSAVSVITSSQGKLHHAVAVHRRVRAGRKFVSSAAGDRRRLQLLWTDSVSFASTCYRYVYKVSCFCYVRVRC